MGKIDPAKPVGWDNALVYGKASFGNSAPGDRYFLLREPDRLAAISRMRRQLYEISLGSVYSNYCSIMLAQKMGTLYGIEIGAGFKGAVKGVRGHMHDLTAYAKDAATNVMAPTREERVAILNSDEFAGCFKVNPDSATFIQRAQENLKESVSNAYQAWEILSQANNYTSPFMDPGLFKGRRDEARMAFGNISKATGQTGLVKNYDYKSDAVISTMSRKPVTVNYMEFLHSLPPDSHELLPQDFEDEKPEQYDRTVNGKVEHLVRNWGRSRATQWKASVYKSLFPGLDKYATDNNVAPDAAVAELMRTWTESRGGASISEFVQNYVR
jgi:hypothetical protein